MKPVFFNSVFSLLVLTLPLSACARPAETAASVSGPAAVPAMAQSSAPQLVVGLPDFTQLVDQVGPAVVNIEATVRAQTRSRSDGPDMDDVPEFFRRFFGPEFQMPRMPRGGGRSMGSGFIISADGYVLTNHHVVDGAGQVKVKLADRREFNANVIGSDQQYDVALLKIDARNLPFARIGDSNSLKPGQWVVAIGSPFGLDHSVTAGIVSATGRSNPYADQRYVPFIQTDVAINQGNSGGPLLNTRGEVVGINSQIFSASGGYMGISFAIPIDLAMSAVDQIKATGRVNRGQIGVMVGPVSADAAQGFSLPDTRGALVNDVVAGSAAAKAGVAIGDVIRSVNGNEVVTASDLPPLVGAMAPGTRATLGILRDGRTRNVDIVLDGEKTSDAQVPVDSRRGSSAPAPASPAVAENLLGIRAADLDAAARRQLGLRNNEGVGVSAVTGNAAREAGLVQGAVILQVGRTPVGSVAELNQQLRGASKGDVVMLLVRYRGNNGFVAIKTGDDN
ncbi:MAG: Do family serine endopeptidase [Xanthomonadaceae bacterium]|jgi:serine protease Do|nr:Do family serine endopeptidase [Xanthomonadaceae bacterium]